MQTSHLPDSRDDVSLVSNDPPFRLQQSVGLIPRSGGLGVGRRALLWTDITWLPIAVWAWWAGRALPFQGQVAEPLLAHFGVHARLLVGIPLLIVAEAAAQRVLARLVPQFVHAGLVRPEEVPKFRAILSRTARLRDAVLPWVIIVGLAFAWAFTGSIASDAHEFNWAKDGPAQSFGFGGWWYIYVGRPVFFALLLGWLWRLFLLAITLKRIGALDLALVPTHADRAGGLGFVERFPSAFSLVVFVITLVISAGWAHQAEYHDLDVHTLYPMMAAALVFLLVVFLLPYALFVGPLSRAKKR